MRKVPKVASRVTWRDESGNASVEFALVAPLLMLVALAVLQLMLAIHVRTVITSAAIEGARVGALVGSDLQTAEERTREVLTENIAGAAVSNITAKNTFVGETRMIAVDVQADLPLLGLYGPTTITMTGHAYAE